MIKILKAVYFFFRFQYLKLKFFFSINWIKTLYFNFRMLPFGTAKKLPIYFYGSVKFTGLKGSIQIEGPIKRGMIGFGQPYEMMTRAMGIAELTLNGTLVFKGYMQFGKDYFVHVGPEAICQLGYMASLGSRGKLICTTSVVLGDYARLGSECQIIDTNFHQLKNTVTGEVYPPAGAIQIGAYNYIGNRVSVMPKTVTSNHCIVASNSLCNKDYSSFGTHILIGGIPAKLLKRHIMRDWDAEKEMLDNHLKNRPF